MNSTVSAQQFDPNIAFFVPVAVAFPDLSADRDTIRSLLEPLDLSDVIFVTARLNLILSDKISNERREVHWSIRHQNMQSSLVLRFFEEEQVNRIDAYIKASKARPGNWQVFFRGQLLELLRQACVFCSDRPDAPRIENDSSQRARFSTAALIASELWNERVYQGRFSGPGDLEDRRLALLGPFRQSHSETSLGPDLPTAFVRGRKLMKLLAKEFPKFDVLFRDKAGVSIDEYYTCLLMVLSHSLGFTSPPGTARLQVTRDFNVDYFCKEAPHLHDQFQRFMHCESQTIAELKAELGSEDQPFDLNVLRRRPIVVDMKGQAIVIDPVFLSEKACVGPLFHLGNNTGFDAFGVAVERYGQELLRSMYPSTQSTPLYDRLRIPLWGRDKGNQRIELADAFLGGGRECVFFEIKGRWLREDVLARAPEEYQRHIIEKYSGKVGVGQLARNISMLAREEWTAEGEELTGVQVVFPVMVAYDDRLGAPLHPRFLAQEFARCLSGEESLSYVRMGKWMIAPLTIMTIDDLELLEASIGHFGLYELLRDYCSEYNERFLSLHNFMTSFPKYSLNLFESARVRAGFSDELRRLEEILVNKAKTVE